ncbi:hypothetical protein NDU88_008499 [Pleurodeles waltl]|uniref:Uncharacterized protein n=1 Tax=Pleurodeles waltl TaxID=8319 RepID=A0AAV7RW98_PLEWA|nr:hypothetical protein NDU88_008499 [Pleurodeles waltl]
MEQRESVQEEARARSPRRPLLGTALTRAGPGVPSLQEVRPRSSGEGPGSTSAVSGPSRCPGASALFRDPVRRVRIVAVGLLLGRCRLFILGLGLR